MKKFNLSLVTVLAMSTFAVAGGDIEPVESIMEVVETSYVEEVSSTGGLYLGLGYSMLKSDSNFFDVTLNSQHANVSFDDDYSAVMFQAGYKVNDYIAVEGRYWLGLTDEAFTGPLNHAFLDDFDTDAAAWGIYVKPMYPVTDSFDVYALLGYGSATVNGVQINGTTTDFDIDGFSWGAGVAYSFTDSLAVFADYVDFQDDDVTFKNHNNVDATFEHAFDSINFGATYQF